MRVEARGLQLDAARARGRPVQHARGGPPVHCPVHVARGRAGWRPLARRESVLDLCEENLLPLCLLCALLHQPALHELLRRAQLHPHLARHRNKWVYH